MDGVSRRSRGRTSRMGSNEIRHGTARLVLIHFPQLQSDAGPKMLVPKKEVE